MQKQQAIDYIYKRLENELPENYFYHSIKHTKDVLDACARLAKMEGVNGKDQQLLETAAAYHDAGLIYTYEGHEEKSIELIRDVLPDFGYAPQDIELIAGMIRATVLPQAAQDYLSMLLCDADLDYLGRSDFEPISNSLRQEWATLGKIFTDSAWCTLQVGFLKQHIYYSFSARSLRNQGLQDNLMMMEYRLAALLRSG